MSSTPNPKASTANRLDPINLQATARSGLWAASFARKQRPRNVSATRAGAGLRCAAGCSSRMSCSTPEEHVSNLDYVLCSRETDLVTNMYTKDLNGHVSRSTAPGGHETFHVARRCIAPYGACGWWTARLLCVHGSLTSESTEAAYADRVAPA